MALGFGRQGVPGDEDDGRRVYSREDMLEAFAVSRASGSSESGNVCQTILTLQADSMPIAARSHAFSTNRAAPAAGSAGGGTGDDDGKLALPEALALLVRAAGGKVRVAKLAAASLALQVTTGLHQEVYRKVLAAVRSRPDLFQPMLECGRGESEIGKGMVILRLQSAPVGDARFEAPALQ